MPAMTARKLTKAAAGDARTFESSLASIGRSVMASRCPSLFRHEIGFQVLDSDDDNTRAVGVFGFRVGDRLLYAPMFYRDGRVKGTGQLRDPRRKTTVPMTDNWVNKLMGEQGEEPAKIVSRTDARASAAPSLWQIKYPPSKYASVRDKAANAWADEARRDLARVIGRRPEFPNPGVDLLKTAVEHPALFEKFASLVVRYPWFADAVEKFHGRDKVAAAIDAAAKNIAKVAGHATPTRRLTAIPKARAKRAGVTVIRVRAFGGSSTPDSPLFDFLPDELKSLMAGRNAYRDERPAKETSHVFTWTGQPSDSTVVQNPGVTGVYNVLFADGTAKPCAVLTAPVGWDRPRGGTCVVINLGDKRHQTTTVSSVWAVGEADPADYAAWLESLDDVGEKLPEGKPFVALTPKPYKTVATVPVEVHDTASGAGGPACSCPKTVDDRAGPYWNRKDRPASRSPTSLDFMGRRVDTSPTRVRLWNKPGVPHASGACLYIPNDNKIIEIKGEGLDLAQGSDADHIASEWREKHHKKEAAAAGAVLLKLGSGGHGLYADDPRDGRRTWYADAPALEEALVVGHHMKVADARALADAAAAGRGAAAWLKYAAPDDDRYQQGMANNFPNAPMVVDPDSERPDGFADDVVPTVTSAGHQVTIEDLLQSPDTAERYRPYPIQSGVQGNVDGIGNGTPQGNVRSGSDSGADGGPSPSDLKAVAGAAQSGRRELFDTASLAALVKHTQLPRLLEDTRPRMMKTVSDLGDLIAHMAWNVDEWTEQFGESEVGPLEDQLQDLFNGLGELALTLGEKQIADPRQYGILPAEYTADGGDSVS